MLAHITHSCEARCSTQFAGAVNTTEKIQYSRARTCLCFWGYHIQKIRHISETSLKSPATFDEEDYEYSRINEHQNVLSCLVTPRLKCPEIY